MPRRFTSLPPILRRLIAFADAEYAVAYARYVADDAARCARERDGASAAKMLMLMPIRRFDGYALDFFACYAADLLADAAIAAACAITMPPLFAATLCRYASAVDYAAACRQIAAAMLR